MNDLYFKVKNYSPIADHPILIATFLHESDAEAFVKLCKTYVCPDYAAQLRIIEETAE